jgi:hypothetical protein
MKSSPSDSASKSDAPRTADEAETFEDGLRLLAKLIAKAILRAREEQIVNAVSK